MSSTLAGTSSATRTLDQRDIAALRPVPAPKPRAPRKPTEKRVVTNGIVCFCGERFSESQALEFMKHLRAEVGEVLDWRLRHLEQRREITQRYRSHPEVRTQIRARDSARSRARWENDPEYRERQLKRKRDPEVRERENAARRERRARKKAELGNRTGA